jgi:hypothetical protein
MKMGFGLKIPHERNGLTLHAKLRNPVIVNSDYIDFGNNNRMAQSVSGENAGGAIAIGRP